MNNLPQKIRLTSISEEHLIKPSELLLPLNSLVNFVNFLEDIDLQFTSYTNYCNSRNISVDSIKFFEQKMNSTLKNHIFKNDNNYVMLEAMSKKSPYWVDLIINASPFIIQAILLIIEENENIEEKLLRFLNNNFSFFSNLSEPDKKVYIKNIIRIIKWILTFVNMDLALSQNLKKY